MYLHGLQKQTLLRLIGSLYLRSKRMSFQTYCARRKRPFPLLLLCPLTRKMLPKAILPNLQRRMQAHYILKTVLAPYNARTNHWIHLDRHPAHDQSWTMRQPFLHHQTCLSTANTDPLPAHRQPHRHGLGRRLGTRLTMSARPRRASTTSPRILTVAQGQEHQLRTMEEVPSGHYLLRRCLREDVHCRLQMKRTLQT